MDVKLTKLLHWHKWTYFRMARSYEEAFPGDRAMHRKCKICGRMEMSEDGENWRQRL
jgi:hypothetical protein